MTTDKIVEAVARAIALASGYGPNEVDTDLMGVAKGLVWESYADDARAAIKAHTECQTNEVSDLLREIDHLTFEEFDIGDWRTRLRAMLSTQDKLND